MSRTVLVVDDSVTVRNIIRIYLSTLGVEYLEADDGLRATQLMRLTPINLLIADVSMPGMDGISLVQWVRNNPNTGIRPLPIILLTAKTGDDVKGKGMAAGANAFIHKPVSSEVLLAEVQKLLPA